MLSIVFQWHVSINFYFDFSDFFYKELLFSFLALKKRRGVKWLGKIPPPGGQNTGPSLPLLYLCGLHCKKNTAIFKMIAM